METTNLKQKQLQWDLQIWASIKTKVFQSKPTPTSTLIPRRESFFQTKHKSLSFYKVAKTNIHTVENNKVNTKALNQYNNITESKPHQSQILLHPQTNMNLSEEIFEVKHNTNNSFFWDLHQIDNNNNKSNNISLLSYKQPKHTENSFYLGDLFQYKQNTNDLFWGLSAIESNPPREIKWLTTDSFDNNFVTPFKHFSNLSIKNMKENKESRVKETAFKPLQNTAIDKCVNQVEGLQLTLNTFKTVTIENGHNSTDINSIEIIKKKRRRNKDTTMHLFQLNTSSKDRQIIKKQQCSKDKIAFKCAHRKCEINYKTKKQQMSHHNKMNPECKNDMINYLKCIKSVKDLVKKLKNNNKVSVEKYLETVLKYEKILKTVSWNDYVQSIVGWAFGS